MEPLTDEQKRIIAENRAKALKLRAEIAARRAAEHNALKTLSADQSPKPKPSIPQDKCQISKPSISQDKCQIPKPPIHQDKCQVPKPSCQVPLKEKLVGICALLSRERFTVNIGYHAKTIEVFKTIPSRAYDANTKKWSFHIQDHDNLLKDMKSLKNEVTVLALPKFVINIFLNLTKTDGTNEVDLSTMEPGLEAALYPFQLEGIRFVIRKGGRALIADDMGLGKTVQAIGVASFYRNDWPLLIVSPSSMRYSWLEAIRKWMPSVKPLKIIVVDNSQDQFRKVDVVIISYDLLTRKADYMKMRTFGVVIVDESHFIKNYKTSRTQSIMPLLQQAKRVILLSGTPALSRPCELYTQLSSINRNLFPSFHEFALRYCGGKRMAWGWDYNGATNMAELQLVMEETVVIRRLKSDVLADLPAKQREMVVLDPAKIVRQKSIQLAQVKFGENDLKGMEKRGALLQYFHETGLAKSKAVSEYVIDQIESGKKFICFVHHESVMNCICEQVIKKKVEYIRIDGKTSSQERKTFCDDFQYKDSCRIAVLSITCANMGLTLTAAQFVVFGELFWNPGILTQAEDRVHRIGQTNSVVIQYLVAKQTADDYLWPIVQRKLDVLNKAGLSKDNFENADTKVLEKSKQRTLDDDLDWLNDDTSLLNDGASLGKKIKLN